MMLAPAIIRVLERRQQKFRFDIAQLARAIATSQASLAAVDETIAALDRRARENASSRYSNGSRSVAELLELEQNSQSLRAGRTQLEEMRERSRQTLDRLMDQQRTLIANWRKEAARLAHVSSLARRERILADVRQFDADDAAFTERYAMGDRS